MSVRVRKKPLEVDAVYYGEGGLKLVLEQLEEWDGDDVFLAEPADGTLIIRTPEGDMRARPGNWIIRGSMGELYPCRGDIFEETYELIEEGE